MKNRVLDYFSAWTHNHNSAAATGQEMLRESRESLEEVERRLRQFVKDYPATSLAAGVCIGIALGWLIKRR